MAAQPLPEPGGIRSTQRVDRSKPVSRRWSLPRIDSNPGPGSPRLIRLRSRRADNTTRAIGAR